MSATSYELPEAMSSRLASLEQEFLDTEALLADPDVLADSARLREISKRYHQLQPIVDAMRRYRARAGDADVAHELMAGGDDDERQLGADELATAESDLATIEQELRQLLVPPDPYEGKAVIVEIRGAEGGEEANLFARDLYDMYLAYAGRRGWKIETLGRDISERGGFNEVAFSVRGDDAWSHLKFEGGPHRVQRVPETESQGRIHTSSATVLVMPEADDVEVDLDENDLQIDIHRSSGPGGQSVNTTDSAVRITHVPTGVVVSMQDERSQLQNRERAMRVLRSRLLELAERERDVELSAERRSQVGGGGRSEKIRTYNYKENRITDHRIGLTLYKLADVLAGALDPVVEPLRLDERTRLLAEETSSSS